jgi:hypothetical protein
MSETEIATGLASVEEKMGVERREDSAAPEPKVFETVEDAARELTKRRGSTTEAPIEKIEYLDGQDLAVSPEQAARHLSQYHAEQRRAAEFDDLVNLASEVDAARAQVYGQTQPQQQSAEQPAPESPQPETPPEASAPQGGLSPRVQAMLADQELRQAIEQPLLQAHQAQQAYTQGLNEMALNMTSYLVGEIPEFQGLNLQQVANALDNMDRQNPARAYEIRQRFSAAKSLAQEAQKMQQAAQVQHQQAQAQQWQQYTRAHDAAFAKATANESPETMRAVADEVMRACAEYGYDKNTVMALYQSDPVMRSAPFQKMMVDAAKYRIAQRGLQHADAKPIPQVQKPGITRTRAEVTQAELGSLHRQIKNSEGKDQIAAAVKYLQAKRAARG